MQKQKIDGFIVPYGWELWADGIFGMDYSQIPQDDPDELRLETPDIGEPIPSHRRVIVTRHVAPAPFWVSGLGIDLDTSEMWVELSTNGSPSRWYPSRVLADRQQIPDLAQHGFPVDIGGATTISRFLTFMAHSNRHRVEPIHLGSRSGLLTLPDGRRGWLWGEKWIGPKGTSVEPSFRGADTRLVRAMHAKGTLDGWRERFVWLMEEATALGRWLVAVSFAAPLLRVSNFRTFIVHHYGDSGGGKTAIARFSQSVWGHPQRFTGSFNATDLSQLAALELVTDFPAAFNELQIKAGRQFSEMIYSICEEQPRARLDRSGRQAATGHDWRTTVRFTGEQALIDNLDHDLGGQRNRILEVKAVALESAKAKALHDYMESSAVSYGVAGPAFLRRLVRKINEDPDWFNREALAISDELTDKLKGADARTAHLAIVALAGDLMLRMMFGHKPEVARRAAMRDALAVAKLLHVGGSSMSYGDKVVAALNEHAISLNHLDWRTRSFAEERYAERGLGGIDVIIRPDLKWEKYTDDRIWFTASGFSKLCKVAGLQRRRALESLEDLGMTYRANDADVTRWVDRRRVAGRQIWIIPVAAPGTYRKTDEGATVLALDPGVVGI